MKKINSIHYGSKIIGIGLILGILIPAVLFAINIFYHSSTINYLFWIFIGIGGIIILIFFIHLEIELHQDKIIDKYYSKNRNTKIRLNDGFYECEACGNQKIRENDNMCPICGTKFSDETQKTPQEIISRHTKNH